MAELDLSPSSVSRRRLLQSGAAGLATLAIAPSLKADAENALTSSNAGRAKRLLFILCTGGPSQLETWDPKPDAPREMRGPYGAVETSVKGIRISETLPRLARLAQHYAVVRSVHSEAPALHEMGMQEIQTGRFATSGAGWPHLGAVLAHLRGSEGEAPAFVTLPRPLSDTGLALPRGEHAAFLPVECGPRFTLGLPGEEGVAFASAQSTLAAAPAPLLAASLGGGSCGSEPGTAAALDLSHEAARTRDQYGRHLFGHSLLTARRLLESGTRCVVVNQFDNLYHQHTWDCHGYADLPTRVTDLKERVAAPFDQAVSALIQDLVDRGLYEDTLVCCFGEFGRTPRLTEMGGRDHHTGCWSVMLGGGGLRGGQVIGASDAHAEAPKERPVTPAMLVATLYDALGVPLSTRLPGPDGRPVALLPTGTAPIRELR